MLMYFKLKLVVKDILVQTVCGSVHLTVNLTHVYTRTDLVQRVLQAGWVIIVLQNVSNPMEKIVETRAVHTVTIRHVKNLKDNASLVVMMDFMVKNVREARLIR